MTLREKLRKFFAGQPVRPDFQEGQAIKLYDPIVRKTLEGTVLACKGDRGIVVCSNETTKYGSHQGYYVSNAQLRRMRPA